MSINKERANKLLELYRQVLNYTDARNWKKEKETKSVSGTSVHFHQVTDSSVIGTNSGSLPNLRPSFL
ncbi:unnamed protein product [Rhizophagus irregularis]|nr:unnamed protein product [Rhizophagus irregularis]